MYLSWDETKAEWICTHEQNEGGRFFLCVACWLCYGRLFQPHHKWALMFHTGFAAEESKICVRASCFDRLSVLPSLFSVWKARDISLSLLHSFFFSFTLFLFSVFLFLLMFWVDLGLGSAKAFLNWSISIFLKPDDYYLFIVQYPSC